MTQRHIPTTNVSQPDVVQRGGHGSSSMIGANPIKVTAYKAELPSTAEAAAATSSSNNAVELQIGEWEQIGQGTFGKVYKAKLLSTQEIVAIKEVEMEERHKSRELDMLRIMIHPNIVRLKYFFYSTLPTIQKDVLYLIMECMPINAARLISDYRHNRRILPLFYIKLFSYQMFRGLGYLHLHGVAHRDLKPSNMIVDMETGVLKICDLGSAKKLDPNERSISYVCTRYYRAPELLLGNSTYTTAVDIWSAGCCLGEFLNGYAIFRGNSSPEQFYHILKIMGVPTREELHAMNPFYSLSIDLSTIAYTPQTLRHYLPENTQDAAIILLGQVLKYNPSERLTCQAALASDFFAELKHPSILLPNKNHLPPLFNFTEDELSKHSALYAAIVPEFIRNTHTDDTDK